MRVKNLRSDLKKLDSFTLETSKNHPIRNFLRNGRLRVNPIVIARNVVVTYIQPTLVQNGDRLHLISLKGFLSTREVKSRSNSKGLSKNIIVSFERLLDFAICALLITTPMIIGIIVYITANNWRRDESG